MLKRLLCGSGVEAGDGEWVVARTTFLQAQVIIGSH
jgi:hypothetical protein